MGVHNYCVGCYVHHSIRIVRYISRYTCTCACTFVAVSASRLVTEGECVGGHDLSGDGRALCR